MPTAQEIIDQMKTISSGRSPSATSDFFPQEGSILMRPQDPSKMNIPIAGAAKTPSGNVVAKTKEISGGVVPYTPPVSNEVPDEVVQAIKQKYTLVEPQEMQPAQPLMQPYNPPEGLKYKSDIGWGDVAIGAIPAVLDAFSGGSGAALGRSVDYYGKKLADESEKDKFFRQKLAEIEKERQKQFMKGAGKESGKLYEAVDDQGNQIWMTREQAIGSGLLPKTKSSASEDRMKISELNRKQAKELADRTFGQNLRKELVKDQDFTKQRTRYSATNDAINILNQRSPIGDRGVTMIFAKGIFGEVGNLTAQEQAKFEGSPAYNRVWDRLSEKYLKTGTLDEADRKDLLDLATAMREASKEGMKNTANRYVKSTGSLGFKSEDLISPLLETNDIAPQYQDLVAKPTSSGNVNRAITPKGSKVPPPGMTKEQFIQWKKQNG